jgi:toxin-antitoxin system PIN domain toxin
VLAVDTNLLVYAHRAEAGEHSAAAAVVRKLAEGSSSWAIPWPCVYEFFSVVTNPRIWHEAASSPQQAWSQLEAWLASPSLQLLGETPAFTETLGRLVTLPRVRGPIVHDARVAALCIAHGVEALLTRDRDFSLFSELSTRNPLPPS